MPDNNPKCNIFFFFVLLSLFIFTMACTDNAVNLPEKEKQQTVSKVQRRPEARNMSRTKRFELPVSVYLCDFEGMKELSAKYTHRDVIKLFDEVNEIWAKWRIKWDVESVEDITFTRDMFKIPTGGFRKNREFRNAVARLIPHNIQGRHWRVYIMDEFPVRGSAVYVSERGAVLYGEVNNRGERLPVILAHEFGHSLGLQHVSFSDNLMYAGKDRDPELTKNLKPWQIKRARKQALIGPVSHNHSHK